MKNLGNLFQTRNMVNSPADYPKNRSVGDAIMEFGMKHPQALLYQKAR
jgi:hypothetical protein